MIILKRGYNHTEDGTNCQDFVVDLGNTKLVMDGCSESIHSEVGVKLFAKLAETYSIHYCFKHMLEIFTTPKDIFNYLLFTILMVEESEQYWAVKICGDGYLITQDYNDKIDFKKIDYGSAPPYYAYNFVDPKLLTAYQDGVGFHNHFFDKNSYKAIGIASDGIRYILDSYYKDEFIEYLVQRNASAIKRLINRQHKDFKDDISIAI